MGLLSPMGLMVLGCLFLNVLLLAAASVRGRRPQQVMLVAQLTLLFALEMILLQVQIIAP